MIVCVFISHSWKCTEHSGSGKKNVKAFLSYFLGGLIWVAFIKYRAPENQYPFWSNAEVLKKIGQQVQRVKCILAKALDIKVSEPCRRVWVGLRDQQGPPDSCPPWEWIQLPAWGCASLSSPLPRAAVPLTGASCSIDGGFQRWFWHWIPSLGKSITSYFSNGVKQSFFFLVCLLV